MGWSPGCWGMWGPGYWGGGIFGMALALLFWAAVLGGGVYLLNALLRRGRPAATAEKEAPLEILKRRYAAGEINGEEFFRMKAELA